MGTEENPAQQSKEAAQRNLLREKNSDRALIFCIDLRVEGAPDQIYGGRRTLKTITDSVAVDERSPVPEQRQNDGTIISKERRQGAPRDVSKRKTQC